MAGKPERQVHLFQPIYDENSEVLILGTFPSVKSRENQFYYGHPQNRFWKVIAALTKRAIPESIEEKKRILIENHIAIWDVIESCEIIGSSDSSIRNVIPADIGRILKESKIQRIFANGQTAKKLYEKYVQPDTGYPIQGLPSTSPANAIFTLDKLIDAWSVVMNQ